MIRTSVEGRRGCGYRKQGGLYMMGGETMIPCSCLPVPLDVCPVCRHGIKPTRGWTWVQPGALMEPCSRPGCILGAPLPERAGLLWVGEKFYPKTEDFIAEAAVMGISRRLTAIPKGLEVGKTLVLFAHRHGGARPETGERGPGIFSAIIPSRIEYVVKDDDKPEKLAALEKRGVELVRVVKADEARELQLQPLN